jgi:hypothetical protein
MPSSSTVVKTQNTMNLLVNKEAVMEKVIGILLVGIAVLSIYLSFLSPDRLYVG